MVDSSSEDIDPKDELQVKRMSPFLLCRIAFLIPAAIAFSYSYPGWISELILGWAHASASHDWARNFRTVTGSRLPFGERQVGSFIAAAKAVGKRLPKRGQSNARKINAEAVIAARRYTSRQHIEPARDVSYLLAASAECL